MLDIRRDYMLRARSMLTPEYRRREGLALSL
jgi:hypothetical protein